jgi:hypothetical protein
MADGPVQGFMDELNALVTRWVAKPEDDRLTYIEMIGVLSAVQYDLQVAFRATAEEAEGE